MSKVLLLFHQPIIDITEPGAVWAFYESFINELSGLSNKVDYINLSLLKNYWDNTFTKLNGREKENIINKIKTFAPEIIFTFNNQITSEIIQNTACPICIMDADNLNLFPNKDFIAKYSDRYYIVSFYKNWESDKYEKLGIKKENIGFLHQATSVRNENIEKTTNISFIGTKFGEMHTSLVAQIKSVFDFEDLKKYYENQYENAQSFYDKYTKLLKARECDLYGLIDSRLSVLQSISDLGLKIYGVGWDKLPDEMPKLKLCYDSTPKYSLRHNSQVYNSSRINISISHPQCKGYAYPWRIYDVMGSSGLLISSYSRLLEEQTKGFVKIPMYNSPYDARELCKYALKNPSYCEDIIKASNEFIEKQGRWRDNFEILQNLIKINLTDNKNGANLTENLIENLPIKIKSKPKNRFKQALNGLLLLFANLPLIELFFSEKIQKKIYSSINKYNNLD